MPAYKNYHGWVTLDYDISVKAAKRQTGGNIDNYQLEELTSALNYCNNFRLNLLRKFCGLKIITIKIYT